MNYYAVERTDSLAHYGRLGMKWYQHIYGQYQGTAKYAAKGEAKLSRMKQLNKEAFPKITAKAMKLSKKQYKYATKAAKLYRVGRDEDAQNMDYKAARFEEAANKLQNQKLKAILNTAKLSDKVKTVKNILDQMSDVNKYSDQEKKLLDNFHTKEGTNNVKVQRKFWDLMEQQTDTRVITDKEKKLEREHKILEGLNQKPVAEKESKQQALATAVQLRIGKESGDLYDSHPVTKNFEKQMNKMMSVKNSGDKEGYKREKSHLCGVVLKDLGYEDDEKSRKLIEKAVFTD